MPVSEVAICLTAVMPELVKMYHLRNFAVDITKLYIFEYEIRKSSPQHQKWPRTRSV